ncbi:MAG TPA: hypothetical protein ENI08_00385 [Candidatus Dependentiae bacterium]|nr:hypothetical protein [Candidatus Dependentiae bacterium]
MEYRELKGYKYELMAAIKIKIELPDTTLLNNAINPYIRLRNGVLTIKKHYCWDGSSVPFKKYVPKWLWDSDKSCKTASLTHDALCQLMREDLLSKKYKRYIDNLYKTMAIEGGMGKWQANTRNWFLRKFGDKGIQKEENPRGKIRVT